MAHRLAPEAEKDIEEIWGYVSDESDDTDVADRLIESIVQRFYLLSAYPHAGRSRMDLQNGLRSFPVGEYVILYRVELADVFILRVVHGRRDIDAIIEQ